MEQSEDVAGADADRPLEQFQVMHSTAYLRYRQFYSALRYNLDLPERPRILVFGCATGAELRTNQYFWEGAEIHGCDISEDVLAEARETAPFANVFLSTEEAVRENGPYDLIAANSVLCRHPFPKDSSYADILPFSTFEHFVNLLVSSLKPDGHLLAFNTNYFIADLDIAADLTPITVPRVWHNGFVPRVDVHGNLVARAVREDNVLQRFVLTGEFDTWERLRAAIYKKRPGALTSADEPIELTPSASLTPDIDALPPIEPRVVEPCHVDTVIGAGRKALRSTFISDPVRNRWRYHGACLVKKE